MGECFNSVTLVSFQFLNPSTAPWKPLYQPWFIAVGGVEKIGRTTVRALWGGGALRVSAARKGYCKKKLTAERTYKSKPFVQRISQTRFEIHAFIWLRLKRNVRTKPFGITHVEAPLNHVMSSVCAWNWHESKNVMAQDWRSVPDWNFLTLQTTWR